MSEIYQDSRGWLYTVRETLTPNEYSEFYRKPGKQTWHRRKNAALHRRDRDAAERDMKDYVAKHRMQVTGWCNYPEPSYLLMNQGSAVVELYINELWAKRKEILDAGIDTAEDTEIATVADICSDISIETIDDYGDGPEYCNGWPVTDNYDADYCLRLSQGRDFVIIK